MKRPWLRWTLTLVALVFLATAAVPVLAQRTGGSFGGGSFGGGGSYGGGSYGGGSYGGGYGGSYSGGGGLPCACSAPLLIMLVIGFIGIGMLKRHRGVGGMPAHGARGWNRVDISSIQLGIDWRARRELQAQLERLAKSGRTGSKEGLARLLRETILSLRRAELSWLYCAVANYHPMSAASAEGIFRQLGVDARSRFKEELHRNVDGSKTAREASAMRARPEEGEGVVVVTLVVAARREILDVQQVDDAGKIKALLDDMVGAANPQALVAMEVIWSPAAEDDRMSTAELETLYPHLKKIDERSIAGRIFCSYCSGPFAAELLECPHCGAPATASQPSA